MPSIYDLKPRFQARLRPLTAALVRRGMTANQVTLLALVLSAAVGGLIALFPADAWPLWIVPPFLFVRMALNAIDGMMAREHQMKSDLGMILNEIGDVLADSALYLPFATIAGVSPYLVVPLVVLSLIGEMTGVVVLPICGQRRYDGPLGKSDRAFLFGLIALLLGGGVAPGMWLEILFGAALVLICLTIINRARSALKMAKTNPDQSSA